MAVEATTTIQLHPLLFKQGDAGHWIVGRPDDGEFVEIPAEGATFLHALNDTHSITAARDRVRDLHGDDVDATGFAETLIELGFVASLDGRPVGPPPKPPSLRRLRPRHIRWAFSPPAQLLVYAFIAAGLLAAIGRGQIIPDFRAFFVTDSPSVNLAWNTAMFLAALALHEFWHLAAARADDIHARFGLGTRLQFLVAQTTVTSLWAADRRTRLRVYLAGIKSDLVICAACSLTISLAAPKGLLGRSLEACILVLLLSISNQFMLYIKTDMYFVLQELLRCKNLYGDAWDYARHVTATALRRHPARHDPTRQLAHHERRAVKLYAGFMVIGSFITVALFTFYGLPILFTLFLRAAQNLVHGITSADLAAITDGLLVLAVEGTLNVMFLILFFNKHGAKLRKALTPHR
ncbi:hypothetical protein [Nonomuraea lactucae]|uniref:hypothetical protein n=1 Tax=Nonomuraea lactucae TaxID=2249762 RepID=UPI000DE53769|nr:hypothetical protein [Nonomuraea lactucae]